MVKRTLTASYIGFAGVPLSSSKRDALLYIIKNGPVHGYALSKKKVLKTEKTVYTILKALTEEGLLEMRLPKDKARPGQPMKEYSVTINGLCIGLIISRELWDKLDIVIEKWGYYLPVLRLWGAIEKYCLKEEIRHILKKGIEMFLQKIISDEKGIEIYLIEKMMHVPNGDIMIKWDKILHEDDDLKKETIFRLKQDLCSHQTYAQELKDRLTKVIPQLDEPEPNWKEIETIENDLASAHISSLSNLI